MRTLLSPKHFALLFVATAIFATQADAEVRIHPHLNNVTPDGVTFSWETTEAADGVVELTPLGGGHGIMGALQEPGTINLLRVEGLEADTEYSYTLESDGEVFSASFKTAPDTPRPIRFCVIGDSRRWGTTVADTGMIDHMLQWKPEFFMINGDLVMNGHEYDQWPEHFERFAPILDKYMVITARGNHEGSVIKNKETDWFGKYHELPGGGEPYASFTWGNSHMVILSWEQTAMPHLQPATSLWLDEHLETVDSQYVFVGQHFPIFCTGYYSANNNRKETSAGMAYQRDVMDKHDIDVHFSGHTHIYERHYPLRHQKRDDENGILYVVNGGDTGGNFPDWWTAVGDDPSQYSEPTYSSIACEDGYVEIRAFAWHREQKEFHQLDHAVRYEDEALPKGLLASLGEKDGEALIADIELLGAMMYGPAARALLPHLDSTDTAIRQAAATAIRSIGVADVSEALFPYLSDADAAVRHEVARAIEIAATPAVVEKTIPIIMDSKTDDKTRIRLLGAIQFHADADVARKTLFDFLSQSDVPEPVRQRAAYALTRVATEDDVDRMIDMFEAEESSYVMVRLALALNQITGERVSTNDESRTYKAAPGEERKRYTKRWRKTD